MELCDGIKISHPKNSCRSMLRDFVASQLGLSKSDIVQRTEIGEKTVTRYLQLKYDDLPDYELTVRGVEHEQAVMKLRMRAGLAQELKTTGMSIREICQKTGFAQATVKRYLSDDFNPVNAHYGKQREGKLAPFRNDVIRLRADGLTYQKIFDIISARGYTGTVDAIRGFISKERRLNKDINGTQSVCGQMELIDKKWIIRLLYQPLKDVKGISEEQFKQVIEIYPIVKTFIEMINDFKKILKSKDPELLDTWMSNAANLNIDEIDSFIRSLNGDIDAVKNSILYDYNNGIAEGSVNKLKVIKRIMYGRCSFKLLRNKLLRHELWRNIN